MPAPVALDLPVVAKHPESPQKPIEPSDSTSFREVFEDARVKPAAEALAASSEPTSDEAQDVGRSRKAAELPAERAEPVVMDSSEPAVTGASAPAPMQLQSEDGLQGARLDAAAASGCIAATVAELCEQDIASPGKCEPTIVLSTQPAGGRKEVAFRLPAAESSMPATAFSTAHSHDPHAQQALLPSGQGEATPAGAVCVTRDQPATDTTATEVLHTSNKPPSAPEGSKLAESAMRTTPSERADAEAQSPAQPRAIEAASESGGESDAGDSAGQAPLKHGAVPAARTEGSLTPVLPPRALEEPLQTPIQNAVAPAPPPPNSANTTHAAQPTSLTARELEFSASNHDRLVTAIRTQLLPAGGSMQIRLDPPNLGTLEVAVRMHDGVMSVAFQSSSAEAAQLLSHSLTQLKHVLESQGLLVDKLHVQLAPPDSDASGQDSQQQHNLQDESFARQEQQRREMVRRMWRRLAIGSDPLDLVA